MASRSCEKGSGELYMSLGVVVVTLSAQIRNRVQRPRRCFDLKIRTSATDGSGWLGRFADGGCAKRHRLTGRRLRSARWRRTAVVEIGGNEPAAVGAASQREHEAAAGTGGRRITVAADDVADVAGR